MKIDTEILCSYIDGELDAVAADQVRAALEADEQLRREYDDLRRTAELVRDLPRVSAPPELIEGIRAHVERDQLLGRAPKIPGKRTGLYWGLSMAASLIIGLGAGILGYHTWRGPSLQPGPPATSRSAALPERPDYRDSEGTSLAVRGPVGKSAPTLGRGLGSDSPATEEKAAVAGLGDAGKSGRGKAGLHDRSGPTKGTPAGWLGGTNGALYDRSDDSSLPAEAESPHFGYFNKSQDPPVVTGSREIEGKDINGDGLRTPVAADKPPPLERQVWTNNYVNRDMASNLAFEAEPLNVTVVSNDSNKTLQYVQRWAQDNSLIDLNGAPAKTNFPVFAQVVYQGQRGTNIRGRSDNGVLLRTTRRQAQAIVNDLQQQRPVVVSVSVQDQRNELRLTPEQQKQLQALALPKPEEPLVRGKMGPAAAKEPQVPPAGRARLDEELRQAGTEKAESGRAIGQMAEPGQEKQAESLESALKSAAPDEQDKYLFQITNQERVRSVEDLVTMVVLIEEAKPPTAPGAAGEVQPQADQSQPPPTKTKPE